MVAPSLTTELIEAGADLVRQLDEQGLRPEAAFWFWYPEKDGWVLIIGDSRLPELGPLPLIRQFDEAIRKMHGKATLLSSADVYIHAVDRPPVSLVREALPSMTNPGGYRLRHTGVAGTLIEDAYVYRVR